MNWDELVHPNSCWFIPTHFCSSQFRLVHPSSFGSFQFIPVHFSSSQFILVHPSSFWFILVHFGSYWTWMNINELGYWTMNQGGLGWTKINKFIPIHLGSVWFISISFILIPIHLVYHGSFQGISVHFVFPSSSQPIQVNFHPLGSSQFIGSFHQFIMKWDEPGSTEMNGDEMGYWTMNRGELRWTRWIETNQDELCWTRMSQNYLEFPKWTGNVPRWTEITGLSQFISVHFGSSKFTLVHFSLVWFIPVHFGSSSLIHPSSL